MGDDNDYRMLPWQNVQCQPFVHKLPVCFADFLLVFLADCTACHLIGYCYDTVVSQSVCLSICDAMHLCLNDTSYSKSVLTSEHEVLPRNMMVQLSTISPTLTLALKLPLVKQNKSIYGSHALKVVKVISQQNNK